MEIPDRFPRLVFGSSTPREFSYLEAVPVRKRIYDYKSPRRSRKEKHDEALRLFTASAPGGMSTSRSTTATGHGPEGRLPFGSAYPRTFEYLEKLDKPLRVYSVPLTARNNRHRSKTAPPPGSRAEQLRPATAKKSSRTETPEQRSASTEPRSQPGTGRSGTTSTRGGGGKLSTRTRTISQESASDQPSPAHRGSVDKAPPASASSSARSAATVSKAPSSRDETPPNTGGRRAELPSPQAAAPTLNNTAGVEHHQITTIREAKNENVTSPRDANSSLPESMHQTAVPKLTDISSAGGSTAGSASASARSEVELQEAQLDAHHERIDGHDSSF